MQITDLTLRSHNLTVQRDFYHYMLGLSVIAETRTRITFKIGDTHLTFEHTPAFATGIYHYAFNIPESQFDEAKTWLSDRTDLMRDEYGEDDFVSQNWNARQFYFRDGEGNIAEFIARHTLKTGVNRPFDQYSLLGVSEVGMAFPSVMDGVRLLQKNLHLPVYRGTPSPAFTAMGDEHGLLILVPEGCPWFPTLDEKAEILPVQVTFLGMTDSYKFTDQPYTITGVEVPAEG